MGRFGLAWVLVACGGGDPAGNADGAPTTSTTDTATPGTTTSATGPTGPTVTPPAGVPQFGDTPVFTPIGTAADGLDRPRDLAFDPGSPGLLWTVNQDNDGTVLYHDAGAPSQTVELRIDSYALHFMEEVSAIAFAPDAPVFATCQESRNTYNDSSPPNDFMGPALWSSDLAIYATVNQQPSTLGSHIDMLHQSPLCVGVESDGGNAFWAFDGKNGNLVYYDFQVPHVPGGDDHSDGIVRRHTDVVLSRVPGVASHLWRDPATGVLLIADSGTGRILRVDPSTAASVGNLFQPFEPLVEYTEWNGATVEVLVDGGLITPSGVVVHDDILFVSDAEAGEIVAYDLTGVELERIALPDGPGVMGLAVGPDEKLWYVDAFHDTLVRVDPT